MADPTIADVLTALSGLRADVMARIDRVQNTLTAIRDDLGVNFGAVDSVRRNADNTREELRALAETVAGMHRQIHRLQTEIDGIKGG